MDRHKGVVKNRCFFLLLGLFLLALLVFGYELHIDKKLYGPSSQPDRIMLTWKGSPATSQAVTWRSNLFAGSGYAEIAGAAAGPEKEEIRRIEAETSRLTTELGAAAYHSVNFTKLRPETKYMYRVGNGKRWSEWNQFETAAEGFSPFKFIFMGDVQNDILAECSRVFREALRDAPGADFILYVGDLINGGWDKEWGQWYRAAGFIHNTLPALATPGNHEYDRRLSRHWRRVFEFPMNGPNGFDETAYYVDYQGVRFISLDSNEDKKVQAEWLEGVLSDNPCRWTIVFFHHPIFSGARGRDNAELRELWQPIFDRHGVGLVFQGHDHVYGRTALVRDCGAEPEGETAGGTVYVVSVCGPKMYELQGHPKMVRIGENIQLYQVIEVEKDRLIYRAKTADGELYDAFTIEKGAEGNSLIEEMSAQAER